MKRKFLLVCGLVGLTLSQWAMTTASAQRPERGGDNAERGGDRGRGGRPGGAGGFRGGGGPGGGDMESALLRSAEVRAELELMPDQEAALKELEKRGQQRPEGGEGGFDPRQFDFRNASEEERAEMFAKIQAMRKEQAEKRRAQLEEVLFPEQMERLGQLTLQLQGMAALADPEVQKKIGITESQVEKMKEFRTEQETKMRESMREVWQSGDREGLREKMKEMRDEAEAAVMKQLEPEQRKKFEEMKGEPFDFSQIQRPEGGRGGRGGGDAGGRGRGPGGDRGARGGRPGGDRPGGGRPGGSDSDAQD